MNFIYNFFRRKPIAVEREYVAEVMGYYSRTKQRGNYFEVPESGIGETKEWQEGEWKILERV